MKPSASAPACTAIRASSRMVIPQILTRVIDEWVGRGAPPTSPPVGGAPHIAPPMTPPVRGAPDVAPPMAPPVRGAPDVPSVATTSPRQRQLANLCADVRGP